MIFNAVGKRGRLLAAMTLILGGALASPRAEIICDPEEMPPPASYADTLLLPDVDWSVVSFYPPEGTWMDSIGSPYYRIEDQFTYFGLVADYDITEQQPPHHYLPFGWRTLKMFTFRWNAIEDATIVREPVLHGETVLVEDPAPGGTDSVLITARPVIHGSYEGHRDQVIRFEFFSGDHFLGENVESPTDPAYDAWSINDGGDWDETGFFADLEPGEIDSTEVNLVWSEAYAPDEEFAFAPGDELRTDVLIFRCTYQRLESGELVMLDSNFGCAHEMALGLWVSFTPGLIGPGYLADLVVEDYEGYHVWRRVNGEENWKNTWKLSKNEERDKFYWWWIDYYIDNSTQEPIFVEESLTEVFGDSGRRVYLDLDVHNGFFYDYAITSYDRGFRPSSGSHDHYILDSTPPDELETVARRLEFNYPAAADLDRSPAVYAVPNPLRTGKSALEDPSYHNYPGEVVRFVGLTDDSTIRVYSLAGDLVFEGENTDPETRNLVWDTRNQKGEQVASGVYIFHTVDQETGEDAYGRLVIIR